MEEVHLSAFDSWRKFNHNKCEGTECQTLNSNIMSPYFANDMFDVIKRQKGVFFLPIYFKLRLRAIFLK